MNKVIGKMVIVLIILTVTLHSKVLLVVDNEYFSTPDGMVRVLLYKQDIELTDGIIADTMRFEWATRDTTDYLNCNRLWQMLVDAYEISLSEGDTLEGAVFIGDLPVPMFADQSRCHYHNEYYPVDYYYMDVWDTTSGGRYTSDLVVWQYPTLTNAANDSTYDPPQPYFDRNIYKLTADDNFEIWISRIYAKPILHLRADTAKWDEFLDEHEILSSYLDRVHFRMCSTATIPPRSILIGTNNFTGWDSLGAIKVLKRYSPIDTLKMGDVRPLVLEEANPFNWQSQLQAGPYGNVNSGAFKDEPFGPDHDTDNTYPFYDGDIGGYEWACLFEHSGPGGHGFNCGPEPRYDHIARNGSFNSFNNCPLFTYVSSGGYDGLDYSLCRNRDNIEKYEQDKFHFGNNVAHWKYPFVNTSKPEGKYHVYMWYKPKDGYDRSYVNINVNGHTEYGRWTKQYEKYPPDHDNQDWQELTYKKEMVIDTIVDPVTNDTTYDTSYVYRHPIDLEYGDTVNVEMAANYRSQNFENDTAIADAVMLLHEDGNDTIIIDNHDQGFYTEHEVSRSYLSMQDDGGQSKVLFNLLQACHINTFNVTNCLGNLYAMGHNGLISMGTSSSNWSGWYNDLFLGGLRNGCNFGKAYLKQAQKRYRSGAYALLGAGTLQARAYNPYYDYEVFSVHDVDIEKYKLLFIKTGGSINNNVNVQNSGLLNIVCGGDINIFNNVNIQNTGILKVVSGNEIIITPEFLADYGSKVDMYIDPGFYE